MDMLVRPTRGGFKCLITCGAVKVLCVANRRADAVRAAVRAISQLECNEKTVVGLSV